MQEHIENLVKLQNVELERARLSKETRALPAEIVQAKAALAAAEHQAAEIAASLSREDALRNRLEGEIAGHRQKAARFRTQLDSVKNPAQAEAIEHEIEFASAETERLENEELASMERTEAQEAALALARAEVETMSSALDKTRARAGLRQQQFATELAALDLEREALRKLIDPQWLVPFDRLFTSRGTGLAKAENQQCTGCSMGLRLQTWNQLREGQMLACDSCNRFLYWDPAMAPAPEEPRPELIPGAGRAPRKPRKAAE
jgi:predicted  nucleic acid-binding Zn-ribbon protein